MRKGKPKSSETIWVLFAAGSQKFGFPNFFPIEISRDPNRLRRLAKRLPTYYGPENDPNTVHYQLFEFPLDTYLAGYTGDRQQPHGKWPVWEHGLKPKKGLINPVFASMIGNFHHEHLNEHCDDICPEEIVQ